MAKYELVCIVDPFLTDEEIAAQLDKIRDTVKRRGGEVTSTDIWGKRRLAYVINKKHEGYYVLFNVEGEMDGASITELERNLRLDEKMIRSMITRVPKPKKPAKVKVKKAKSGQHAERGDRHQYAETHSAGSAGATATQHATLD